MADEQIMSEEVAARQALDNALRVGAGETIRAEKKRLNALGFNVDAEERAEQRRKEREADKQREARRVAAAEREAEDKAAKEKDSDKSEKKSTAANSRRHWTRKDDAPAERSVRKGDKA